MRKKYGIPTEKMREAGLPTTDIHFTVIEGGKGGVGTVAVMREAAVATTGEAGQVKEIRADQIKLETDSSPKREDKAP